MFWKQATSCWEIEWELIGLSRCPRSIGEGSADQRDAQHKHDHWARAHDVSRAKPRRFVQD